MPPRAADQPLVVHEWGTFTALQDEHGDGLPGINIDDEPLPAFCHNLGPWVLEAAGSLPRTMMKGAPQRHPYVTLRLETPVIYFHPPRGASEPFSVDVDVRFHGGWLTEFYPRARPEAPGLGPNGFDFGAIHRDTVSSLYWRDVRVGTSGEAPACEAHIWTAPRDVNAAMLNVGPQANDDGGAESEKFLFYRGVGNRPAPLRAALNPTTMMLSISRASDEPGGVAAIDRIWLVDVRSDHAVAWRTLAAVARASQEPAPLQSAAFAPGDYSPASLDALRDAMHRAMVDAGLFDDEATAMLATWRRAYYQSPGLRIFFVVPRAWTDSVLPLTLSRPAKIERVMMGRLELISPRQRQLLARLDQSGPSDAAWFRDIRPSPAADLFFQGRADFGNLGVSIPADYQAYLDLGRFRNALLLAEQKARPSKNREAFIDAYSLHAYEADGDSRAAGN